MIRILGFDKSNIAQARKLALANYNEEKSIVTALPQVDTIPDEAFEDFIENGLGVAMFDDDNMLGFLCAEGPWNNAFNSAAKGIFVPIHAHGVVPENREGIYKRLYQAAAEIWVNKGITYHAVSLYAHNLQAKDAFFSCGFGSRCVDAVRLLTNIVHSVCEGVTFEELADASKISGMRKALSIHLGESPCFMRSSDEDREEWVERAESRDSREFIAMYSGVPIAFIEVTGDGENFATWKDSMLNICGAFCLPDFRGKGVMQGLLNYVITQIKTDEVSSLGVDFESFNLSASGFWLKHFSAYTFSVTRRIDECAINN